MRRRDSDSGGPIDRRSSPMSYRTDDTKAPGKNRNQIELTAERRRRGEKRGAHSLTIDEISAPVAVEPAPQEAGSD